MPLASTLDGTVEYIPLLVQRRCKKKPLYQEVFPMPESLLRVAKLADNDQNRWISEEEAHTLERKFCFRKLDEEREKKKGIK